MVDPGVEGAHVTVIDRLVAHNASKGASNKAHMDRRPRWSLALVTCMDCRIDVYEAFGLALGDVHVLRNAGGIVTDDTIRSLVVSQRSLGTRLVMVVHHTDCGLHRLDETAFKAGIVEAVGKDLPFDIGAFEDLDAEVRESMRRITDSPFVAEHGAVRGFVYDVDSGMVREVQI